MACVCKGKQYRTTQQLSPPPNPTFAIFVHRYYCVYETGVDNGGETLTWHAIEVDLHRCVTFCDRLFGKTGGDEASVVEEVKTNEDAVSNQVCPWGTVTPWLDFFGNIWHQDMYDGRIGF